MNLTAPGSGVASAGLGFELMSEAGVGFVVPAGMALIFAGVTLGLSARLAFGGSPGAAVACLLGTLGVLAQTRLAATDPGTVVGFLAGTAGASVCFALGSGALRERINDGLAQTVVVTSLLWIAGTITVVGSVVSQPWPFTVGTISGLGILAAALVAQQIEHVAVTLTPGRSWAFLAVAFVAPSVFGLVFGADILFVAYLVAFVTVLICWSLLRLAYSSR